MRVKIIPQTILLPVLLLVHILNPVRAGIDISGFATAGLITGDLETDFISGPDVISESAAFGADNTLGVLIASDINDKINVGALLLAKGTDESYSVAAQWAYIAFEANSQLSSRLGRLNFPATLFSEHQEIGFSYPWIRNPMEVYTLLPMATYSGVDVLYTVQSDKNNWHFQPFLGSSPAVNAVGGNGEVNFVFGLSIINSLEHAKVTITAARADGVLFAFSASGGDLHLNLDMSFLAAGLEYERHNFLLITEIAKKDVQNNPEADIRTVSDMTAYYLTLGYRMGNFLPHFTYAGTESEHSSAFFNAGEALPSPPPQGIPPEFWIAPQPMMLPSNGELFLQKSFTLGLRYDFNSQTALKVDYQKVMPDEESWGLFFSDPGEEIDLLSFAVDVVF